MDLVLNSKTKLQIKTCIKQPSHAVALVGPAGSGKATLATHLAASILGLTADKLESYAYFRRYAPEKGVITVEMARDITSQMRLRTTGDHGIRRVIVVEDAHAMTIEAQNALLKILEEPPTDTVLILTITTPQAILPTIKSRLQLLTMFPVSEAESSTYFVDRGYSKEDIRRCYLMSGGLPGLMHAMLESDSSHPLMQSIDQAKTILQADTFTRLAMIDDIAKQKQLPSLLTAFMQTAQAALSANAGHPGREKALEKWALVLREAHVAQDMLGKNANAKLVLTNLFLNL